MADLLALKKLTASDLTFFERLFRTINAGNQKAINLNADVLVRRLYPNLAAIAAGRPDGEISFPLTIQGPALAAPYRLQRKIVKGGSYKNWRLNGEFVYDPVDQPGRFNDLRPGDIAVFGFNGQPAPEAVTLVLLSQGAREDAAIHRNLAPLVAGRSMSVVTAERLRDALGATGAPTEHPLAVLALDPELDQALEDVALGGAKGERSLRRRRAARPVSPGELKRAKLAADLTGADGEALVDDYLGRQKNPGGDWGYDWVSSINAISPYDFRVWSSGGGVGGQQLKIEFKATRSSFGADVHISLPEPQEAAGSTTPYLIYRVFELTDEGGKLGISHDIRP